MKHGINRQYACWATVDLDWRDVLVEGGPAGPVALMEFPPAAVLTGGHAINEEQFDKAVTYKVGTTENETAVIASLNAAGAANTKTEATIVKLTDGRIQVTMTPLAASELPTRGKLHIAISYYIPDRGNTVYGG